MGREGSASLCVCSIWGQTHPSNPDSKAQPGPGERDRQTDRASCVQGERPYQGPTGSPWAPTWLQGAPDPAARRVSYPFPFLWKQEDPHTFSDRETLRRTPAKPRLPARWDVGDHPLVTHQARHTSVPEGGGGPRISSVPSRPENPSSAAGSLLPANIPLPASVTLWLRWPPLRSHSHRLQAGFFSSNQSTALQRLQEGVLSPPQGHLCAFLCTSPFPCWKHEWDEDWSVLTLPGQQQPGS